MIKSIGLERQFGYIFLFIAILTWGFSTTFIDFGLKSNASPLSFLGFRFLLALLVFTPYIALKRLDTVFLMIKNRWIWVVGLSESTGLITQYFGQQEGVPAGLSALLIILFLVIVPFIAPIILREKIKKYHFYGIILGLLGVLLVTSEGKLENLFIGNTSLIGVILLLVAAFCYAIYIVSTSRVTTIEIASIDVISLFYVIMGIISLMSLGLASVTGELAIPPVESWIWIVLLTIFSTLIAFLAYFKALKTVPANTASVLLILQLVVPFIIDILFLRINYSVWIFLGAGTIIFAIIVVLFFSARESKEIKLAIAD